MIKVRKHFCPWFELLCRKGTISPVAEVRKQNYLVQVNGKMMPLVNQDGSPNLEFEKAVEEELFWNKLKSKY